VSESAAGNAESSRNHRPVEGLKKVFGLLALIFVPAGIYALHVIGQLEHIREHNLRGLDNAAQAAQALIENARTNVRNLLDDQDYACTFFERQTRLRLIEPDCEELAGLTIGADFPRLNVVGSRVQIVGGPGLRIEVVLEALLQEIPFAATFDQLLIVNQSGALLGTAVAPHRTSPMLPPGLDVRTATAPIRILNLATPGSGSDPDEAAAAPDAAAATSQQTIELAGRRFDLLCQPWRIALDAVQGSTETWRLCGLVDSQRSFQQALEVAPHIVILLLALLTLAVVSWPILKVLSLAASERLRFSDMYLILLATLTLVMLLAVAVADVGTYAALRKQSEQRLAALAAEIESHLRAELTRIYDQLHRWDDEVARAGLAAPPRAGTDAGQEQTISIGCLLLPPAERGADCAGSGAGGPPKLMLSTPETYPHLQSVFWMRPCDGRQFIKGSVLPSNTPAVTLGVREYFQAVKRDRLWDMAAPPGTGSERLSGFVVDSSASVTTGEFFAALAIRSQFSPAPGAADGRPGSAPDCNQEESERYAAAITGQPVSVQYPVLAPGVGFAIAGEDGRVVFHSDERRAVFENLFADEGVASRLRAAMVARATADFYTQYQTRPHQVHVRPIGDLPWTVMTFADDEVLRTAHVELLVRTAVLVGAYLLSAFLGTLLYMLFHGREAPVWMWPRRERRYQAFYFATIGSLAVQLVVFLLALDVLHGWTIVLASLLLPVPALLTVVLAARTAQLLDQAAPSASSQEEHRAVMLRRQHRNVGLTAGAALGVLLASVALLHGYDPVSATHVQTGYWTVALVVLLVALVAVQTIVLPRSRPATATPTASAQPPGATPYPWIRWWRNPLAPHMIGTAFVWFLLGVLPSYGFFKFALASQMTVLTKQEQSFLARAFAWRGCEAQNDFRLVRADPDALARRLDPQAPDGPVPYFDIYRSALLSRDVAFAAQNPAALSDRIDGTIRALLGSVFSGPVPLYNETTTFARYLGSSVGGRWSWLAAGDAVPILAYRHRGIEACDRYVPDVIAARLPAFEPQFGWVGLVAGVALFSLLVAWVSFGARRLFFGDIEADARKSEVVPKYLPLDRHLGRLGDAPDLAWVNAEVEPLLPHGFGFDDETRSAWCRCTTRRAVVDRMLDEVRGYYDQVWQKCSDEQRLLLIQLVEEGFANPKQAEVVRKLLKEGVLRRDPVLRPMNHSFAVFVEGMASPEDVRRLERDFQGLRGSRARGLLLAALVLLLVFLSFTQRDVVEVWIAYIATAAAGAAGVLKLLSLFSRPSAQKLGSE